MSECLLRSVTLASPGVLAPSSSPAAAAAAAADTMDGAMPAGCRECVVSLLVVLSDALMH